VRGLGTGPAGVAPRGGQGTQVLSVGGDPRPAADVPGGRCLPAPAGSAAPAGYAAPAGPSVPAGPAGPAPSALPADAHLRVCARRSAVAGRAASRPRKERGLRVGDRAVARNGHRALGHSRGPHDPVRAPLRAGAPTPRFEDEL